MIPLVRIQIRILWRFRAPCWRAGRQRFKSVSRSMREAWVPTLMAATTRLSRVLIGTAMGFELVDLAASLHVAKQFEGKAETPDRSAGESC